jgi:DNA-binding CsgD family transcriptional regulator
VTSLTWILSTASFAILMLVGIAKSAFSEEAETRFKAIPFALLRLARRRLPHSMRGSMYEEEWLPELYYKLASKKGLPVTRFVVGCKYALGLVWRTPVIVREFEELRSDPEIGSARSRHEHGEIVGDPLAGFFVDFPNRIRARIAPSFVRLRNGRLQFLTIRERNLVLLLSMGSTTVDISNEYDVHIEEARVMISDLLAKLDVYSLSEVGEFWFPYNEDWLIKYRELTGAAA